MRLRKIIEIGARPFVVPERRISLYAVGWYLGPYLLVALLISLIAYGVLGQGHAAAVVAGIAWVLASVLGAIRVLPSADRTGGSGGQGTSDKSDTPQQDARSS